MQTSDFAHNLILRFIQNQNAINHSNMKCVCSNEEKFDRNMSKTNKLLVVRWINNVYLPEDRNIWSSTWHVFFGLKMYQMQLNWFDVYFANDYTLNIMFLLHALVLLISERKKLLIWNGGETHLLTLSFCCSISIVIDFNLHINLFPTRVYQRWINARAIRLT